MAFDGITVAAVAAELKKDLLNSRIYKIAQPESDELIITLKTTDGGQKRLLLSADASLPLTYFTSQNKPSPMTAPSFTMLLRKHLQNGRITGITQPGLERIIELHVEHYNDMGDLCHKRLIIELMGKHSNIIFVNEENKIIDSIKHISGMVSSVREVLPGRDYFIPETQDKIDPLTVTKETFCERFLSKALPAYKAIYCNFTGLSPFFAQELCYEAGVDGDLPTEYFTASSEGQNALTRLYDAFSASMQRIKDADFAPVIVYENGRPVEFSALPLLSYPKEECTSFPSISELLEHYYAEKNTYTRIRQRSVDLRKIVQTILERDVKKYDLQLHQMKDTEKKDKYKVYGELINTYGYHVAPGSRSMEALNYYTNEMITIPLDPQLTPIENSKKYFDKYGKLKRTCEALSRLTVEVRDEIDHLESIQNALDIAQSEDDLAQIREEMMESGYIRRKGNAKKARFKSHPLHYVNPDGFHIYVGKNNFQNDELTFQFATGNDWWFHAKGRPGSHVIVKCEGRELTDATYEDAARLAAFYSKAKGQSKIEVDYLQKKNVKKPGGAKPGFVVYYTNYSMLIDADISRLTLVNE